MGRIPRSKLRARSFVPIAKVLRSLLRGEPVGAELRSNEDVEVFGSGDEETIGDVRRAVREMRVVYGLPPMTRDECLQGLCDLIDRKHSAVVEQLESAFANVREMRLGCNKFAGHERFGDPLEPW